jgi:glutaredoxin
MVEDKWVILGQKDCVYCDKVRTLFADSGYTYTYYDISLYPMLKYFIQSCGLTSVPQVYINGFLIGGYEDTKDYIHNYLVEGYN